MCNINLGYKVKKRRVEISITAEELADICEVTPATIKNIQADRRGTSLHLFVKLCNALKVMPEYLLSEYLTFKPNPDKQNIYKRLDTLTPKQLHLLDELITTIKKYDD